MVQLDTSSLPPSSTVCLNTALSSKFCSPVRPSVYIPSWGNKFAYQFKNKCNRPSHFAKSPSDATLHFASITVKEGEKQLFIFILQGEGLVMIDVCLPQGTLAAQHAWNNRKKKQEEE